MYINKFIFHNEVLQKGQDKFGRRHCHGGRRRLHQKRKETNQKLNVVTQHQETYFWRYNDGKGYIVSL